MIAGYSVPGGGFLPSRVAKWWVFSDISNQVISEDFLQTEQGLRLFYRRWEPPKPPQAACIVVHGLGEHGGRYEALAQALNSRALTVWAMDHRGHGRSDGRRGDCCSIHDFAGDLHLLIQKVRSAAPQLPRVLIGHSLGGLVSVVCAAQHPGAVHAVALSSPAFKLTQDPPRFKVALAEGLARLLPRTPIPNGINPEWLSRDPEIVQRYKSDPLVHRALTARCAVALRQAMAESLALARELKIPCLILQAGSDRICDPGASAEFAKAAPDSLVRFQRYDGFYHELFNEPEKGRVMNDLIGWIQETLAHGARA